MCFQEVLATSFCFCLSSGMSWQACQDGLLWTHDKFYRLSVKHLLWSKAVRFSEIYTHGSCTLNIYRNIYVKLTVVREKQIKEIIQAGILRWYSSYVIKDNHCRPHLLDSSYNEWPVWRKRLPCIYCWIFGTINCFCVRLFDKKKFSAKRINNDTTFLHIGLIFSTFKKRKVPASCDLCHQINSNR